MNEEIFSQPDFYRYYKSIYGRFLFRWVDIEKIKILRKEFMEFRNNRDRIVIDLGCGSGRIANKLNKFGVNVLCCDINKLFLREISNSKIPSVALDLNYSLPFKKESVNGIVISDVIEHISNDKKIFDECYRILDKKGIFILFTPSHDSYRWRIAEFIHNKLTKSISGHVNPFNEEKLRIRLSETFSDYYLRKINFGLTLCGIGIK